MITVSGVGAPELYYESIVAMRMHGQHEESRNGPVLAIPEPVCLELLNPRRRVVFDEARDANPFYHVMEAIWMFAGERDVTWLTQFNSGVGRYCDEGMTHWHGAYGYRWRSHFGVDQITKVAGMLLQDPTTRRAVIGMWNPAVDLEPHNDLPCNTHLLFRVINGRLNMTVINRSNDLVWGAMGANVVHMTMLHELIAEGAKLELGTYRVVTNNLHVYQGLKNLRSVMDTIGISEPYIDRERPLLDEDESMWQFLEDCKRFVKDEPNLRSSWIREVASPMRLAYQLRKAGKEYVDVLENIGAEDWKIACQEWIARRAISSSVTSTAP